MATLVNHAIAAQLASTVATVMSTTSAEKKFIGKATLTNTSTAQVEVTIWRLPTATTETEGSGGNWFDVVKIPASRSIAISSLIQHELDGSQKISMKASVASVVNLNISGTSE